MADRIKDKAGLSRREIEILQDEGYTGVGQEGKNFAVWRHRIKNKISPTLRDTLLVLRHCDKAIDLKQSVLTCKAELLEIRQEIDRLLAD